MHSKRSFQGDLSLLSPANLFQMIGLASLSGQLVIRGHRGTAYFIFAKGKFNYGFSQESRKKIGQIFLDSGFITLDQLNICLADQKSLAKWKKLGSIVVENGYMQLSELVEIFHAQVKETLFETLTWKTGSFTFVDSSPLTDDDIVVEANIDSLILQGLHLFDETNAE
ncbi:MAG: DUF4388 domain-containing protein [Desulfocapsaceae bacterium]|nr:DUF4388 domain-containing protein [Desulfocapsaceae bacterium]